MASRKHRFSDPQLSSQATSPCCTDWNKCALCQETGKESLQCPAESSRADVGAGYATVGEHLHGFAELNVLSFNIARLDEGDGVVSTLTNRKAKWHKSCALKYTKLKLQRAQKRKTCSTEESESSTKFFRCSNTKAQETPVCFLCDKPASKKNKLREVTTFVLDQRVRQSALELQDKKLLAKLSAGDLIAQEAKYHSACLIILYRDAARLREKDSQDKSETVLHGIALAELINFIEDSRSSSEIAPVFKLSDLAKLYTEKLASLGVDISSRVHTTRLKERILSHFPDLQAHKEGRDILLAFEADVGDAIRKVCVETFDDEGLHFTKTAKIIRREMLKSESSFKGHFPSKCQQNSVPQSLLALVRMILEGPNIKSSHDGDVSQTALSISQLLLFNSHIRRREGSVSISHSHRRETPLPIYVGVMLHAKTRKRELVDTLFSLGLSVSYDRVLSISTQVGNRVIEQFEVDKMVCPPKLRHGILTGGEIDNIDHDPSSTSAQDSFHGTSISLSQQPTVHNHGTERLQIEMESNTSSSLKALPVKYTNVPPLVMKHKEPQVPALDGSIQAGTSMVDDSLQKEKEWLTEVQNAVESDSVESEDQMVSWAAYHATNQPDHMFLDGICTLLPLFSEDSKSAAMISHAMEVVKDAVQFLNPGQVPFVTLDQPLYAIAKKLQWDFPQIHGEDKYVVLLGGLHIEMAVMKVLGDWLEDSGWVNALVQAQVASPGRADSFLKGSHVTRTCRVHQVTASCLYILLCRSYAQYSSVLPPSQEPMSLEDWAEEQSQQHPTFQFWNIALKLELLMLVYMKSIREANFQLYIESLVKLAPWMFAFDHYNYARWLPVHIRDMATLHQKHPDLYAEFMEGHFAFHKTKKHFSAMALDQAHEQNNAIVKGDGGAVGLTQKPAALARWMVAGPEMARLLQEFEDSLSRDAKEYSLSHHEETKGTQCSFKKDVKNLVAVFEEFGNPFMEQSNDLLVLDSNEIMDSEVVQTVREIENLGTTQYEKFVQERLVDRTTSLYEAIKKNKLPLFHSPPLRKKSNAQLQVQSLKNDCSLFSRLYITCQMRDGDLDQFFTCENQAAPPSLSLMGKLRPADKAPLLPILENLVPPDYVMSGVDAIVIDGSVVINMLKPGSCKTFMEYADQVFTPYILAQLQGVQRLDIVWDVYVPNSLKATTRARRGQGKRRRVTATGPLPGNWSDFLKHDMNKTELYQFLASHLQGVNIPDGKHVYATYGHTAIAVPETDVSQVSPCCHEEADTRIFVHVADAVRAGHHRISIRTVDTDVVVLSVFFAHQIPDVRELWVAFGTGKSYRYIPAHIIAEALGEYKVKGLLFFHAYSGCDTVSAFYNRSKATAWSVWQAYPDVTETFYALSSCPQELAEEHLAKLERYTVLLYDRTSSEVNVNACRKVLFTKKGRQINNIPPSHGAIVQHIKRAALQAGHVWSQSLVKEPEVPDPSDWGWTRACDTGPWQPLWTLLPEATKACRELTKCSCKTGCRKSRGCGCARKDLKCTALCHCSGECAQDT